MAAQHARPILLSDPASTRPRRARVVVADVAGHDEVVERLRRPAPPARDARKHRPDDVRLVDAEAVPQRHRGGDAALRDDDRRARADFPAARGETRARSARRRRASASRPAARAASRARRVAPSASRRGRARRAARSISGVGLGRGERHDVRPRRARPDAPRASRASWRVVVGTYEPQTTSTPSRAPRQLRRGRAPSSPRARRRRRARSARRRGTPAAAASR